MSERSGAPAERPPPTSPRRELPSADVADFIRFCHLRRTAAWPEIYDDMCLVAARREFNGWGYEQLAAHGVTFALGEMPRLAAWVRTIVPPPAEPAAEPRLEPRLGLAPA